MSNQPEPLTPPDCDLRCMPWMPLFGEKLFNSTFESHASDLAFRVAIKLYWECWRQVPAASLPNDDVQLCRLAGLGRDLKTWRKLRADGVLHGFILCSDDRLYHRLIADEAIKAWNRCHRTDRERDIWREQKRRQRNGVQVDKPDCPGGHSNGQDESPPGHPGGQTQMSTRMSASRAGLRDNKTVRQEREHSLSSLYSREGGGKQIPWRSGAIELVYEEGMAAKAAEEAAKMAEDRAGRRPGQSHPLNEIMGRLGYGS